MVSDSRWQASGELGHTLLGRCSPRWRSCRMGGQVVASSPRVRGDNWFPTASCVIAYVLVMPPIGRWLGRHLGLGVTGLMVAVTAASFLPAAVLIARMRSLRVSHSPRRS